MCLDDAGEAPAYSALLDTIRGALKRQRETEAASTKDDEASDAKRQKTAEPVDKGSEKEGDVGAAGFDIGAMLEDALGSIEPMNLADEEKPAVASRYPAANSVTGPGRRYQKKMRFSQNPAYLVRSMSLPLLGTLVRRIPRARLVRGGGEGGGMAEVEERGEVAKHAS